MGRWILARPLWYWVNQLYDLQAWERKKRSLEWVQSLRRQKRGSPTSNKLWFCWAWRKGSRQKTHPSLFLTQATMAQFQKDFVTNAISLWTRSHMAVPEHFVRSICNAVSPRKTEQQPYSIPESCRNLWGEIRKWSNEQRCWGRGKSAYDKLISMPYPLVYHFFYFFLLSSGASSEDCN